MLYHAEVAMYLSCGYDLVVMIVASQAIHTGSNPVIRTTKKKVTTWMKKKVKIGDSVELVAINDTWTKLKKGSRGIVTKIEEDGGDILIWVDWENGEHLALLDGIDRYILLREKQ